MSGKDEILTLIDEKGEMFNFFVIDYFSLEEQEYTILLPADGEKFADFDPEIIIDEDSEEGEGDEAIILRVVKGNNGEDTLQTIDDELEWEKVTEIAYERLLATEEE
jgi:uncharacterized protein YrzB (UPF0473 family)